MKLFHTAEGKKKKKKNIHACGRKAWVSVWSAGFRGEARDVVRIISCLSVSRLGSDSDTSESAAEDSHVSCHITAKAHHDVIFHPSLQLWGRRSKGRGRAGVGGLYHTHHVRRDFDQAPESVRRFSLEHFVIIRCQKL